MYNLHPSSELSAADFFNEWQRVAVDKAIPTYEQYENLLSYAEWLQDGNSRLNESRNASIGVVVLFSGRGRPVGVKRERIFTDLTNALGFAALVNGTVKFWDGSNQLKVVWYEKEEA